jgi:hypothetical protein
MRFVILILAAILATPTTSSACWRCHRRPVRRPVCRPCRPVAVVPTLSPAPQPTPQTAVSQWSAGDEAGAFLAALNQWRAWHGRHPVSWDANLAAWAATNAGVHDGRPMQCWSGQRSLLASLRAWEASPAHAAILLTATVAVGAAPCPSGATANCR